MTMVTMLLMKKMICVLSAPPAAPTLSVVMTTNSSVQLSWMAGSNGGSRILGFVLRHRRQHSVDWASRRLSAANRSHVVSNLRCGSDYSFYLQAVNRLGKGQASQVVHAATNGSGMDTHLRVLQNAKVVHFRTTSRHSHRIYGRTVARGRTGNLYQLTLTLLLSGTCGRHGRCHKSL